MRRGVLCLLCVFDTVMRFQFRRNGLAQKIHITAKSRAKMLCKTELLYMLATGAQHTSNSGIATPKVVGFFRP
jgi:hypothetical protein